MCRKNHIVHSKVLKLVLDYGIMLEKLNGVIKVNQEARLKPYIDMNKESRTRNKNDFEKDLFKLMNDSGFGNTMENVRNHRDINS